MSTIRQKLRRLLPGHGISRKPRSPAEDGVIASSPMAAAVAFLPESPAPGSPPRPSTPLGPQRSAGSPHGPSALLPELSPPAIYLAAPVRGSSCGQLPPLVASSPQQRSSPERPSSATQLSRGGLSLGASQPTQVSANSWGPASLKHGPHMSLSAADLVSAFWAASFGIGRASIPFDEFCAPFEERVLGGARMTHSLYSLIVDEDVVWQDDLCTVVELLWPPRELCTRADELMHSGWFHGFIDQVQSSAMLFDDGRPGAFLVRFSCTQKGVFTLSRLVENASLRAVVHHRISRAHGVGVPPGSLVFMGETFPSLPALIQSVSGDLGLKFPVNRPGFL